MYMYMSTYSTNPYTVRCVFTSSELFYTVRQEGGCQAGRRASRHARAAYVGLYLVYTYPPQEKHRYVYIQIIHASRPFRLALPFNQCRCRC
jgi:hypothetical protein